jgi:hypothetical protein
MATGGTATQSDTGAGSQRQPFHDHLTGLRVESATPVEECLSCRTLGTVVPLGCAVYLVNGVQGIPRVQRVHRAFVMALAGGFAAMGVARALI